MEKEIKSKLKKPSTTVIEIDLIDRQTLIDLGQDEKFISFILKDAYQNLKIAIDNNLSKVSLFNIFNLSILVEVKRSNYSLILKNIMEIYELAEDYEECSKIKNLIKKLDEKI